MFVPSESTNHRSHSTVVITIEKSPHVSGPTQFKLTSFKVQLYMINSHLSRIFFLCKTIILHCLGTSLAIPWLRLCASTAGDVGSVPGWGSAACCVVQPKRKKERENSIVCIYHILLIRPSVDGHLTCFYVLAVVNNAAMIMSVHTSLQNPAFNSFGYKSKSRLAESYGYYIFNFLRTCHTLHCCCTILLLFSHPVMSNSLQPHGLQHTRPPCPSPRPVVCQSSSSLHQWCCPTISFSDALYSFYPQSFPASGTFPISCLFASDDQILVLQHQSFQWIFILPSH